MHGMHRRTALVHATYFGLKAVLRVADLPRSLRRIEMPSPPTQHAARSTRGMAAADPNRRA